MTVSYKRIAIAILAGLSLLTVFAAFDRAQSTAPPFDVSPLPKGTHILTADEVDAILTANFNIVETIQQIPKRVRDDYTMLANEPFEMVNPRQEMSTDYIIPGVPNKKLVLVGIANQCAVLIFIRGGYANTLNAAVFSHKGAGAMWGATIEDYSVHDIAALRNAVRKGQFKVWRNTK